MNSLDFIDALMAEVRLRTMPAPHDMSPKNTVLTFWPRAAACEGEGANSLVGTKRHRRAYLA